jgi:hypothetical protein
VAVAAGRVGEQAVWLLELKQQLELSVVLRTAGDQHNHGLHHLAAHLHALLQSVRHRKPGRILEGSYALIFRNMAILGVQGISALPTHCLVLSIGFFTFAVATNVARDFMPHRYRRYVPLLTAMVVPFLAGANFTVDMCVGSLVVFA